MSESNEIARIILFKKKKEERNTCFYLVLELRKYDWVQQLELNQQSISIFR